MTAGGIGFLVFLLALLILYPTACLIWKRRDLKHYKYEVKLITGETFVAIKTLSDWWHEGPWDKHYTIEKSDFFASGTKLIVPVRNRAYTVVIDIRKSKIIS